MSRSTLANGGVAQRRWIGTAFFCSGAAGLVYQVVWSRILHEIFGISAHAVTAVLASYLGGLALGGWWLGSAADRARSPLRLYAWLELGIAGAAVAGTGVAALLDPLHLRLAAALAPDSPALLSARLVLASIVVLPATFLMGATLPAMTRVFFDSVDGFGRGLAGIYALNTAGAVAGCLIAGFVGVRAVGVHGMLWIAVATNTSVAALCFALARGQREARRETAPASSPTAPLRVDRGLLLALALAGFASLYLEVVWTRLLQLLLGTSAYAFVTMLATFLVGIALGGLGARFCVERFRDPRRAFGYLQLAIAAATLATLPLTRTLLAGGATVWLDVRPGWLELVALRFGVAFGVMLLPTVLIGASFPLAARLGATREEWLGGSVGVLYAANTVGNIAGAALGGFVLLPALGMQRSIGAVATLNLGAALWGLAAFRSPWQRLSALSALAGALALVAVWRPSPLPFTAGTPQDPLLFYEEGLVSTVTVFQQVLDGDRRVMSIDAVAIGQSTAGLDRKQQVLAHLPFLLAPAGEVRDVLSIGLGTGILVAEAARHPGVERVEAVELSPSVVEAARWFSAYNGEILDDPRVRVIVDDGVLYLRRTDTRYDAISADGKSRSGHAGNAVFYSKDFYRAARAHLSPRGTFLQWVPLDVAHEELQIIVRTFVRSFPHSYVWLGEGSVYLQGQDRPLELDVRRMSEVLASPASANLRRYGWSSGEEAAAMLIADGPALEPWLAAGDGLNSVEHPVLEFYSLVGAVEPMWRRIAANLSALALARTRGRADVRIRNADADALTRAQQAVGALLDGLLAMAQDQLDRGEQQLRRAAELAPQSGVIRRIVAEALVEFARTIEASGLAEQAFHRYARAIALWPAGLEAQLGIAQVLARAGQLDQAEAHLRTALEISPLSGSAHRLLGGVLATRGDSAAALEHLHQAARLSAPDAEIHLALGLAQLGAGSFSDALREFRQALRIRPDWPPALVRTASLLATAPDPALRRPREAIRLARRAVADTPTDASFRRTLAAAYAAAGEFDAAVDAQESALRIELSAGDEVRARATRETLERYRRRETPLPLTPGSP